MITMLFIFKSYFPQLNKRVIDKNKTKKHIKNAFLCPQGGLYGINFLNSENELFFIQAPVFDNHQWLTGQGGDVT